MLVNPDAAYSHPYVAISNSTSRIIHICEAHIEIMDASDSHYFEGNYMPTSRSITFNLDLLDELIKNYTGQETYKIITRFTEEKHSTLTYHSPTNEAPKDYDIFVGYPDERTEVLVEEIYPLMFAAKEAALHADELEDSQN